jgi:Zn-dependent protease
VTLTDTTPGEAERPRGPWDDPLPAPATEPPIAPRRSTPGAEIAWALASTALLAGWLTWQLGWVFGVAGVLGVLVHEFGHLAAINALGCGPGRILIIPFFGGAATMTRAPDTEFKSVLIALAGPVAGLIATSPFFLLFAFTGDQRWLGGAFFVAVINLFNLAPAPPLDGAKALGPVLAWIHPWLERGVLILIGAVVVIWAVPRGSYILAVVAGLSLLRAAMGKAFRAPARRMTRTEWASAAGLCVAAVGLCLATTFAATIDDPLIAAHLGL